MMSYRVLTSEFGQLPAPTSCGLAFGTTDPEDVIHMWPTDTPGPDDVCICGAFYFRAVDQQAQKQFEEMHAALHAERHEKEAAAQEPVQAALALEFQQQEEAEAKQKQEQEAASQSKE